MESRQKTLEQLKKDLSQKIKVIKSLLGQALKCECESDERIEYSNVIASSLRAILYGDRENNNQSLIQRIGYDKRLLFPLYSPGACLNVIPTNNLLSYSISNEGTKVMISDNLFKTGGMWGAYLTFDSWINEIVIDTKLQNVEPLSRLLIVKNVADTIGAHVDNNIEKNVYEMAKHDLLPVVINGGVEVPRNLDTKAKSIICETILAIAKELIDANETWAGISPKIIGSSDNIVRVQKYTNREAKAKYELLKYDVINKNLSGQINSYNSNCYYECDVYSNEVPKCVVTKNRRMFEFIKIDYKVILEGEYLGKSIYPKE